MSDSLLGQAWASLKYVDEQCRKKCPEVYWCVVGFKVLKTADYVVEYFTRPVTKTFSVYREADCDYRLFSKGGVDSKSWYAKGGAQRIHAEKGHREDAHDAPAHAVVDDGLDHRAHSHAVDDDAEAGHRQRGERQRQP